jgi:hypothetical protein
MNKKKKNTFRDRTVSILQMLEGLSGTVTRNIQRGQLNIRVQPTTRVPQNVIDNIRRRVEDQIPRAEIKSTFEKPKETTWGDIINLIWKNKDLIQLVGKDIFKGMTSEEVPPMAEVIDEKEEKEDVADRDEGKNEKEIKIDVGEIKLSPAEKGELKPDVSIGRLTRNIPETEFTVITEVTPIREMGILNRLEGNSRGEIKRAITDNAQVQISQFNVPPIQADVIEGNASFPFFVGLTDRRYPVNAPIPQLMTDYPNIDLVDLYGLQLERLTDADIESL